jgi:hypothetical protein
MGSISAQRVGAASVRGPSHKARRGKAPVLEATEARQLRGKIGNRIFRATCSPL